MSYSPLSAPQRDAIEEAYQKYIEQIKAENRLRAAEKQMVSITLVGGVIMKVPIIMPHIVLAQRKQQPPLTGRMLRPSQFKQIGKLSFSS